MSKGGICSTCGPYRDRHNAAMHALSERLAKVEAQLWSPQPTVLASAEGRPVCPSSDCLMCSGEACDKCGAGCWNNDPKRPRCEHDVLERHEKPREAAKDSPVWTCPGTEKCNDDACDNVHAPAPQPEPPVVQASHETRAAIAEMTRKWPVEPAKAPLSMQMYKSVALSHVFSARVADLEARLVDATASGEDARNAVAGLIVRLAEAEKDRDRAVEMMKHERDTCLADERAKEAVIAERERVNGWWRWSMVHCREWGAPDERDDGIASGAPAPKGSAT